MEDAVDPSTTPSSSKPASGHHPTGDPLVDNPYIRVAGYAARISRLLGPMVAGGSRYLAYTSDVGEAFRPVVPLTIVRAGYAISWTYVLADVALQAKKARDENRDYIRAGMHAAVFQSFGSMLFPAMIIHTVVHQSDKHVFPRLGRFTKWGPTSMGLAVVPFLPFICDEPVERATDFVFDRFWPSSKAAADKKKHE
jgi:fission process protein 1